MKQMRSMLFVPGNKPGWIGPATECGADAIIVDLEDSVPEAEKEGARALLESTTASIRASDDAAAVVVRPNGLTGHHWARDFEACVAAGVDALYLPKVFTSADVVKAGNTLDFLENKLAREGRPTSLVIALETASSINQLESIASSSSRIDALVGATAKNADVARSVGFRWTDAGLETLYLRSRTVIVARSYPSVQPISGLWQDVRDLEGLRLFARTNRNLGFSGQIVIHPSHVPVVNEEMMLTDEEIAYFSGLVSAYEKGDKDGVGAVNYEGEMIDLAHVVTARELLAQHEKRGDCRRERRT